MKQGNPSRREFLRTASAAAAGSLAPSFFELTSGESPAHAGSVREGMDWESGSAAMRWDVYNKPHETEAWYIEGERSEWRFPHDLGIAKGTVKDTDRNERFAVELIQGERPHKAKKTHTHGFATLVHAKHIDLECKGRVLGGELAPPLAPPSIPDIYTHMWLCKKIFEPAAVPFEDLIFDPSGRWTMALKDGPFSRIVFAYHTVEKLTLPDAIAASALSPHEQLSLLECVKRLDSACVEKHNDARINAAFEEYRSLRIELGSDSFFDRLFRYGSAIITMQKESASMDARGRQEKIGDIIECARELDIKLSFEPYATTHIE